MYMSSFVQMYMQLTETLRRKLKLTSLPHKNSSVTVQRQHIHTVYIKTVGLGAVRIHR